MKLVVVLGSRNTAGQTARAAEALAKGFAAAGGEVEKIILPALDIQRCRQCNDDGWGSCRSHGDCAIDDDMPKVVASIASADAAAFATPVYFSDLSESMRALLDRLRRTCMHDSGRAKVAGTPAVGVCVAGGGGGGAPECTASLTSVLDRCGFDCVDMIPVRRQNLDMKAAILAATGKRLAASLGGEGIA